MKAIISTTYDDKYIWYLPLTVWAWNKLGVDVVCFMPYKNTGNTFMLVSDTLTKLPQTNKNVIYNFDCPKHKEATYAQCSRLYGACLDLPEDEILISSDIDMLVFNDSVCKANGEKITSYGFDLTPESQLPMCYATAKVSTWRKVMQTGGRSYQQCLDDLLGDIDCDNMRGNYWAKDQEELADKVFATKDWFLVPRAKPGTQFADKRYDRDDAYILDRLSPDTIDYHMNRPGYEDGNFSVILQVLQYHYPNENFQWLIDYNEEYKKLL
jgi:hypothetical protein